MTTFFILVFSIFLAQAATTGGNQCKVKNQSGTMDIWYCRDSQNSTRCYADVEFSNGTQMRIWGGECWGSFSDCWWNGPGAVDPCD